MKTVKIEGSDVKGKLPETWDELTVGQFIEINKTDNIVAQVAAFIRIDREVLGSTKSNVTPIILHMNEFWEKAPDFEKLERKPIEFMGRVLAFPKTLDFSAFGASIMAKNLIGIDSKVEKVAKVFAIYAQPLIDGRFESERVPFIEKEVLHLSIVEVYPWNVFFLKKFNEWKNVLIAESALSR